MHYTRMEELIEDEFGRIRQLRATKGLEYADEIDTLADFKEVAEEVGATPLQVWATYVKKHQRAIDSYIKSERVRSESIEERIRDVIVYHLLLLGLIEDQKANEQVAHPTTLDGLGVKCEAVHEIGDAEAVEVEHLHHGETIRCELVRDHLEAHYGRTPQGHGFQWSTP